jgi:3-hydroxymyristoyl/3-hydroxydecanoyl-(acyl carrier protein) dehydratase
MRCLLIDRIVTYERGKTIVGIKNVTMSENFLQDHFPNFPVMPGVLQLEAVVQLSSWLIYATTDFKKKAKLASVKSIKFKDFVKPGDQMIIKLVLTSQEALRATFDAKIFVNDKIKTDIRNGAVAYVNIEDLDDSARAKEYFLFITGKAPMGGYEVKKGDYLL